MVDVLKELCPWPGPLDRIYKKVTRDYETDASEGWFLGSTSVPPFDEVFGVRSVAASPSLN